MNRTRKLFGVSDEWDRLQVILKRGIVRSEKGDNIRVRNISLGHIEVFLDGNCELDGAK